MTKTNIDLSTALAILQQAEYDLAEFGRWWQRRQSGQISQAQVKPEKMTLKLHLVQFTAKVLFFLPIPTRFKIALGIVRPFQAFLVNLYLISSKLYLTILRKRGLVVVAIAGSYGKTSTKHWLNHLLSGQVSVLMTAKSINTPLGIARTILNQLKGSHRVLIVELGEYYRGDIKALAGWLEPDYGVVTPIGHQHLERMKTIEEIAATIGELPEYFEYKNAKERVISAAANSAFFKNRVNYYGAAEETQWQLTQAKVTLQGTSGLARHSKTNQEFKLFCPLYGRHQLENSLAAFWLANQLSLDLTQIANRVATMPAIPQRHQPHFLGGDVLMLDNSYNTNPEVMKASLELINEIEASQRLVITLGYVELGSAAQKAHFELGKMLAKTSDRVALIESEWTAEIIKGWQAGAGQPTHITSAPTPEACLELLKPHFKPGTVLLFEGGYREVLV